jgi:hypothetical protein
MWSSPIPEALILTFSHGEKGPLFSYAKFEDKIELLSHWERVG